MIASKFGFSEFQKISRQFWQRLWVENKALNSEKDLEEVFLIFKIILKNLRITNFCGHSLRIVRKFYADFKKFHFQALNSSQICLDFDLNENSFSNDEWCNRLNENHREAVEAKVS